MNLSFENIIKVFIVFLFFSSIAVAANEKAFLDTAVVDAKVQELFKFYNENDMHQFYKQMTQSPDEILDEKNVSMNLEERKQKIGKLIKSDLLFSQNASPNLLYLFYQSTYEHAVLTEVFCFSFDSSTKTFKLAIDYLDVDNSMRNEGERDERVNEAELKVQMFRGLYNQREFDLFYQDMDAASDKDAPSKNKFLSMMNGHNKRLGKYVSSNLIFSRSKHNGVILTYLTQCEKYAIVELWGFARNTSVDSFRLRVYNSL